MNDRQKISNELSGLEDELQQLIVKFEQYFSGVEKRAPLQDREKVARQLRRMANRRIAQTDLRFRYQTLATRFHNYAAQWDRLQRLMDEGRMSRQFPGRKTGSSTAPPRTDPTDRLYRQLLEAHSKSDAGAAPKRQQVEAFLKKKRHQIRERFGDRDVEFRVVSEGGRPKIKVRAKK